MVNWGVIGCGGIARRRTIPEGILPASNAKLCAITDADGGVLDAMARELGVKLYRTPEEMLKDPEIQAVYIATPAWLHHRQAIAVLKSGRHALVEKPLALTIDDGREMIDEASRAGVNLGVGYMMRFHGLHRKLREMISSGDFGRPVLGRAQLSCWYPPIEGAWRQDPVLGGGGSLIDMGNHCLDLLEYIFSARVAEIHCFTATGVHDYRVEDSALVSVRFDNGALGVVDTFFSIPDSSSKNRLEIYGSRGSVLAEESIGQSPDARAWACLEQSARGYDAQQARTEARVVEFDFPRINTYRAQIEEFSAAIMEKRQTPVSGGDGLWSQKLVLAAYDSARTGRAVRMQTT